MDGTYMHKRTRAEMMERQRHYGILIPPGASPSSRPTGGSPTFNTSKHASAASMPDFMAVCVPLILTAFRNPAEQPTSAPPGNVSFGSE